MYRCKAAINTKQIGSLEWSLPRDWPKNDSTNATYDSRLVRAETVSCSSRESISHFVRKSVDSD